MVLTPFTLASLLTVAPALAVIPEVHTAAEAPQPDPENPTVSLSVQSTLAEAEVVTSAVRERISAALSEHGVVLATDADARLEVIVAWSDAAGGGYRVWIGLSEAAGVPERRVADVHCTGCGADELLDEIAAHMRTVTERLQHAPTADKAEPRPAEPASAPRVTNPDRGLDRETQRSADPVAARPMEIAGLVMTVVGPALSVAGAAAVVAHRVHDGRIPAYPWVVLGAGGAMMAAGVPLYLTARARQHGRPNLTLSPAGLAGRF